VSKLLGVAVIASLTFAPITVFACGDSMAYDAPDKVGMQSAPAATKAPVTVAKSALPAASKQAAKEAKAPAQDVKLKVASTK